MKNASKKPAIDRLEPRTLRSVSLDHGTLKVIGTSHNDKVVIYADPKDASKIDAKLNHKVTQFDMADVKDIYVSTRRGNDSVDVGQLELSAKDKSAGTDITFPSRIYAGAGDDVVNVTGGKSHIFAGEGMDVVNTAIDHSPVTVYGEGGMDEIQTGIGNDLIVGGDGNDILSTNPGNDTIDGGNGDDQIVDTGLIQGAAFGNDLIHAGPGKDTVKAGDGNDTIDGGAGDDTLDGGGGNNVITDPA